MPKKKRTHYLELARDFNKANFLAVYKEYVETMRQLHKTEIDGVYRQKIIALKEACMDAANSHKLAKKYKDEYPTQNFWKEKEQGEKKTRKTKEKVKIQKEQIEIDDFKIPKVYRNLPAVDINW
jgi:hypothetical protein